MGDDPSRSGDLSFDKAEFTGGTGGQQAECAFCKQPLVGSYYLVGGQSACERCKTQYEYDQASVSGSGRFLRALVFGLGASAAGSALWYAVRATTGYEVGLIAIVVGLMVGGAVRAGSRQRGGALYQALAILLTYVGICAQYVPDLYRELRNPSPQPQVSAAPSPAAELSPAIPVTTMVAVPTAEAAAAPAPSLLGFVVLLGLLLVFALAAPFLAGIQNIIGLLIIGFALYEAWKMNKRVPIVVEGPFRLVTDAR
jgi:hypothetical protein